jgi:uncharacterized protein (TIGR03905 family)
MHYEYMTKGTCSRKIVFDMDSDETVHNIVFTGGCAGNLAAIPKILEGWKADDISGRLLGNDCNGKGTSCADQLAKAVIAAKAKLKEE